MIEIKKLQREGISSTDKKLQAKSPIFSQHKEFICVAHISRICPWENQDSTTLFSKITFISNVFYFFPPNEYLGNVYFYGITEIIIFIIFCELLIFCDRISESWMHIHPRWIMKIMIGCIRDLFTKQNLIEQ